MQTITQFKLLICEKEKKKHRLLQGQNFIGVMSTSSRHVLPDKPQKTGRQGHQDFTRRISALKQRFQNVIAT